MNSLAKTTAALLLAISFSTPALAEKPCANLTGKSRTACLNADVEAGRREIDRINRSNDLNDAARGAICTGRKGAKIASDRAGAAFGPGGQVLAKGTFAASTTGTDYALGNKEACKK